MTTAELRLLCLPCRDKHLLQPRRHGPTTHHPVLTLPPPVPPSPVCRLHPNMIIMTFHRHQVNTGNICHNAIVRVHSTRCPVITRPNNPVRQWCMGSKLGEHYWDSTPSPDTLGCVWRWSLKEEQQSCFRGDLESVWCGNSPPSPSLLNCNLIFMR